MTKSDIAGTLRCVCNKVLRDNSVTKGMYDTMFVCMYVGKNLIYSSSMPILFCFQETRIRRAEALMILAAEYKKKSVADKDGLSTFVTQMGAQTG